MNEELDKLAKQVRNTYFLERRLFQIKVRGEERGYQPNNHVVAKWDGLTDSRGVRHTPIWPKIVKYGLSNNIDPVKLVKAIFHFNESHNPPYPEVSLTPKAVEKARNYECSNIDYIKELMNSFKREANQQVILKRMARPDRPDSELWREVITSPTITAGPLFRFVLSVDTIQIDLVKRLWHKALFEYIQSPNEYNQIFGKCLPNNFKEEATTLLRQLIAS